LKKSIQLVHSQYTRLYTKDMVYQFWKVCQDRNHVSADQTGLLVRYQKEVGA